MTTKTTEKKATPDNMKLWNSVSETDPNTTKEVSQRGGFTSICAQAQIKRATELWGPYGTTWKIRDCVWRMISDADGTPLELTLDAVFEYPMGSFEISSDTAFRAGNDSRKKLLTDVTTKSLSKLGFNSDVFEGLFDDNKYVTGLHDKYSNKVFTFKDGATRTKWLGDAATTIKTLFNPEEIAQWEKDNAEQVNALGKNQKAAFAKLIAGQKAVKHEAPTEQPAETKDTVQETPDQEGDPDPIHLEWFSEQIGILKGFKRPEEFTEWARNRMILNLIGQLPQNMQNQLTDACTDLLTIVENTPPS